MATSNRFLHISSTCKFFALLTLTLFLVNAHVVNAQDNTNSTISNNGNTNINANRNSNANANTNVNTTQNGNVNSNGKVNSNVNDNSNQTGSGASVTPSPTPCSGGECRRDELAKNGWFSFIIVLMFAVVLVPFAWIIMRAVKYSSATYRSPLGLPEGSLRAMLAFTLVAFVGFYILASILSFSAFDPPQFLLGIVATVIGFYFGSRTGEDKAAGARTAGTVQGSVIDKTGTTTGGANVELSQADGKKLTQKADANGKYKFDNVPGGDYNVQASLTGHESSDIVKVKITAGAAQTVNLALK